MRQSVVSILVRVGVIVIVGWTAYPATASPLTYRSTFYRSDVATTLAPDSALVAPAVAAFDALDPTLGIEVTTQIPVSDEAFTASGVLQIYRILQSISTMEGIEYYSASRDEMQTFYHDSYVIAGPADRSRRPDPVVSTLPANETLYVFQRDGSFGRNVQRVDYTTDGAEVLIVMRNLTTMFYNLIPLVQSEGLVTTLLFVPDPAASAVTVYANLGVRVPGVMGMENRARNSFYYRLVALSEWFADQLSAEGLSR